MDQPAAPKPLRSNRALIFIGLFALLVFAALVLWAVYLAQPQMGGLLPSPTDTPSCIESRLIAGTSQFNIQPAPQGWTGELPAIPSDPGLVYWTGGDSPNYTLVFNPDRQNQVVLGTLKAGMTISVNWDDCSVGAYTIQSVELRTAFDPAQVDPKMVGVTLYLPLDGTGRGLVVTAKQLQSSQAPLETAPAAPTAPAVQAPAILSTQACPEPGLALGTTALNIESGAALAEWTFAIQPVSLAAGAPLPELPQAPGLAYLLSGAAERQVFLLAASLGADPAALQGITQALHTAEDCRATIYQLSPPQSVDLSAPGLLDSLQGELAIFVPGREGQPSYVLQGTTSGELIVPPAAAPPVQGEVQVEIGLQEVKLSPDGGSIQVTLSIYNFSAASLPVTASDLQLTVEGVAQPPSSAQPALPLEIPPGQTLELALAFPHPAQGWGVLRVFSIEYELADFVE